MDAGAVAGVNTVPNYGVISNAAPSLVAPKCKRQTLLRPAVYNSRLGVAYFIAVTRLPSRDLYCAAVFPCSVPFWIVLSSAETVSR